MPLFSNSGRLPSTNIDTSTYLPIQHFFSLSRHVKDPISAMFEDLYVHHLRRIVYVTRRSFFNQAGFLSWDEKMKRATRLKNGREYRLFQIFYASYTFPYLPLAMFQCLKLTMEEGQHDKQTILLAYVFALFTWAFVPYSWLLMRYSRTCELIQVAEATLNLDKQFTGAYNLIL